MNSGSKEYKILIQKREHVFQGVNLGNLDIFGRTSIDWLKKIDHNAIVVDEVDIQSLTDTVVLYSDIPLVNESTLKKSFELIEELGINNAELPYGYIISNGKEKFYKLDKPSDDFIVLEDTLSYAEICEIMQKRINTRIMLEGVVISAPKSVYIDDTVKIGQGTVVGPNNVLKGNTVIGENVVLEFNNNLTNTEIGSSTKLTAVVAVDAKVGDNTSVGPYAYLRPNANVGSNCKVGDFVEIKNANIADKSKVPHLAYVGDADVGSGVNVGCGVIFANYDGKKKHRTKVGDNVFLGSNTTLIAPIEVGNKVFIAAGSTVAQSISDGALVIARARETIKEGRAEQYLKKD